MTEEEKRIYQEFEDRFKEAVSKNKRIQNLAEKLADGTATYQDAWEYANKVGHVGSRTLIDQADQLIADDIDGYEAIMDALYDCYDQSATYAAAVQTLENQKAGIGIKGTLADFDRSRASGIAHLGSNADDVESAAKVLGTPVEHFTENVVGDTIKANEEFQYHSGLNPKIKRTSSGKCCQWCDEIAGIYDYPAPDEVYRRHRNCNCLVEYYPGNGLKQNVHTKRWQDENEAEVSWRKETASDAALAYEESNRRRKQLDQNTLVNQNILVGNTRFKKSIDNLTESVKESRKVYSSAKEILNHRSGTHFEDLAYIDSETGKVIINKSYDYYDAITGVASCRPNRLMTEMLKAKDEYTIIGVHNHCNSSPPSINDIMVASQRKYKYGMVICHNGDVYKYTIRNDVEASLAMRFSLAIFNKACYDKNIKDIEHAIEGLKKYGIGMEVSLHA